jgi:XTP/dITP diphosphohydrolase
MTTPTALGDLVDVVHTLLGEDGCPWDREQTHETLIPYLLEEVFELIEALETGSAQDITEELGDVLYQILFHAEITARRVGDPVDIDDIAGAVADKMRSRHPHVFDQVTAVSVDDVKQRWADIKAEQKSHRSSVLEGIPEKLSALARAQLVAHRGSAVAQSATTPGWPEPENTQELGDMLFHLVAVAQVRGLNAESALRGVVREYENRVRQGEAT